MKECPQLLDSHSPVGLKVYQLGPYDLPTRHIYPDKPLFLEDGRSFLFDSLNGIQICRMEAGGVTSALSDLVPGLSGVDQDPDSFYLGAYFLAGDGRHLLWQVKDQEAGEMTMYRADLQDGVSEEVFHASGLIAGGVCTADQLQVQTVNYNGTRIACVVNLGQSGLHRSGIVVIDCGASSAELVFETTGGINHLRYCPWDIDDSGRDLLYQHQHLDEVDRAGKPINTQKIKELDLHVLRDSGDNRRDLPFAQDGKEICIGHQQWRRTTQGIEVASVILQKCDNSFGWADGTTQQLASGVPIPVEINAPHVGCIGRDHYRHLLSAGDSSPRRLCHLSVDDSGLRFAVDTFPIFTGDRAGMAVYLGDASTHDGVLEFQYLLNTGLVFPCDKYRHAHPVISPDGSFLLFNSDHLGELHAFVATNLPPMR